MLGSLLEYSSENPQTKADLRKEMKKVIVENKIGAYDEWRKCYNEELKRGKRGGGGEQDGNSAGIKAKMKDNRPLACKWTKAERDEIRAETEKWEAEHGKLDKLSRSLLSKTKKKD